MTDSDDDDYEHIDYGRQPEQVITEGPDSNGDGRKRLPDEQGPGGLSKKRREETIPKVCK